MVIGKAARCRFVLRRVWWLTEESHKVSCYVQEAVLIVERGESHGVMLCSGGRGDSGQTSVTRRLAVSRRGR